MVLWQVSPRNETYSDTVFIFGAAGEMGAWQALPSWNLAGLCLCVMY